MCGSDEGDVVAGGEADAETSGGALVIVNFDDLEAEGATSAVFERFFSDERGRLAVGDGGWLIFGLEGGREKAGDEGIAHEPSIRRDGCNHFKAIREASGDFAEIGDERRAAEKSGAVGFRGFPESIAGEVAEWQFGIVLIVVLADEEEAGGEAVAEFLAPRDVVRSGQAFIEEIQRGEEQERLVGPLVGGRAGDDGEGADV